MRRLFLSDLVWLGVVAPNILFVWWCLASSPLVRGSTCPGRLHSLLQNQMGPNNADVLSVELSTLKVLLPILTSLGAFGALLIGIVGKPIHSPSLTSRLGKMEAIRISKCDNVMEIYGGAMAVGVVVGLILLPGTVLFLWLEEGWGHDLGGPLAWFLALTVIGSVHVSFCLVALLVSRQITRTYTAGLGTVRCRSRDRAFAWLPPLLYMALVLYIASLFCDHSWLCPIYASAMLLSLVALQYVISRTRPEIVGVLFFSEDDERKVMIVKLQPEQEASIKGEWFIPAEYADESESHAQTAAKALCRYLGEERIQVSLQECAQWVTYEYPQSKKTGELIAEAEKVSAEARGRMPAAIHLVVAHPPETLFARLQARGEESDGMKYKQPTEILAFATQVENCMPTEGDRRRSLLPLLKVICERIMVGRKSENQGDNNG